MNIFEQNFLILLHVTFVFFFLSLRTLRKEGDVSVVLEHIRVCVIMCIWCVYVYMWGVYVCVVSLSVVHMLGVCGVCQSVCGRGLCVKTCVCGTRVCVIMCVVRVRSHGVCDVCACV